MSELQDLEAVKVWDGDQTTCHWCGEDAASWCIKGEAVCRSCHTVAYERALIRDRNRWQRIALAAEEFQAAMLEVLAFRAQCAHGSVNLSALALAMNRGEEALARFRAATEGEG